MTPTPNKPSGRRPLILHPLLLAMYVVLAPLAENIDIVGPLAVRTMVIVLVFVTVILVLLRLLVRDPLKAGLVTSGLILLFATYGHAARVIGTAVTLPDWARGLLLVAWLGLAALWVRWVLRRAPGLTVWNTYANGVALILLAFPMIRIVTYTRDTPALRDHVAEYRAQILAEAGVATIIVPGAPPTPLPDIYYVILDAYARADVLTDLYGYDNSPFLEALAQRGFAISDRSCSNYRETVASLASSLNMAHVNASPEALRPWVDTDQEEILRDAFGLLIHQNRVAEFLRSQGYEWVVFDSGYNRTAVESADVFARSPGVPTFDAGTVFELMLLDTTVWQAYLDFRGEDYVPLQEAFDHHRARVQFSATHLADYADRPGPQFVFAHIIAPHQPYVFGPHGEPLAGVDPFTFLDQATITEWDPAPYLGQVTYLNSLLLAEIDEILLKSEPDPIIVLQGDHGARVWTTPDPSPETQQWLLFPNLLAYRFSEGRDDVQAYATMTPVNLFRVILDRVFGTDLRRLPDENYELVERNGHLAFEAACVSLGGCGPTDAGEPAVGLPTCR